MDRRDSGDFVMPRPGDGAVRDDVWAGDVDNVRVELGEVAPDPRRQSNRQPIFCAGGNWDRGDADEIAGRRESGVLDRRRIDADLDALPQQVSDEAVQRLIGAVADVIVIARKEGDAEVARLHADGL